MIIVVVIMTCWFGQIDANDIMCLSEIINSGIDKSLLKIGKKKSSKRTIVRLTWDGRVYVSKFVHGKIISWQGSWIF